MATQGSTRDQKRVLYGCGELRPRWSRAKAIGLGGRWSGAALYAESRCVGRCVGGFLVRSENVRVQSGRAETRARRGPSGRHEGKAGVALGWHHDAVQVCVRREARRGRGARERPGRSGRSGRPGGVVQARLASGAQSVSRFSAAGKRSAGP
jgi:hypothetical protein